MGSAIESEINDSDTINGNFLDVLCGCPTMILGFPEKPSDNQVHEDTRMTTAVGSQNLKEVETRCRNTEHDFVEEFEIISKVEDFEIISEVLDNSNEQLPKAGEKLQQEKGHKLLRKGQSIKVDSNSNSKDAAVDSIIVATSCQYGGKSDSRLKKFL